MSERRVWLGPATMVNGKAQEHEREDRVRAIMTMKTEGLGVAISFAGDIAEAVERWRAKGRTHIVAYDRRTKGNSLHIMLMGERHAR